MKTWNVKIRREGGHTHQGVFIALTPVEAIFRLSSRDGVNHGEIVTISVKEKGSK